MNTSDPSDSGDGGIIYVFVGQRVKNVILLLRLCLIFDDWILSRVVECAVCTHNS
jgi:hypothetical protein